jgi:hypothetical protein
MRRTWITIRCLFTVWMMSLLKLELPSISINKSHQLQSFRKLTNLDRKSPFNKRLKITRKIVHFCNQYQLCEMELKIISFCLRLSWNLIQLTKIVQASKFTYGEVEKMEGAEMAKRVVKRFQARSILSTSLHNSPVVIITLQQLVLMVWFWHGAEVFLDNLVMGIPKTTPCLHPLNL